MLENYIMYILMIENKGYLNPLTFSIYIIIFKFGPALVFGPRKDKVLFSKKSFMIKKYLNISKTTPKQLLSLQKWKQICQFFFFTHEFENLLGIFFFIFWHVIKKWGIFIYWVIPFYRKKKTLKNLILGQKNKDGQKLQRILFIKNIFLFLI